MKFTVSSGYQPHLFLKRLGYGPHDSRSGAVNFVRRLRPGLEYPRYHLYVSQSAAGTWSLDLHIDQKAETRHYNAKHAHNAEHDGSLVEEEKTRIISAV